MEKAKIDIKMSEILAQAVKEPGQIMSAYRAFHGYSFGNQLIAWMQCTARGIQIGPIATYKAWTEKGRQVRKGEKAISLCMPVTCKKTETDKNGQEKESGFTRFVFRNNWFVLSQTDGPELPKAEVAEWIESRALEALKIKRVEFNMPNGNVQGYATADREIAINPLAQVPMKTLFHELGHIVLGHTSVEMHEANSLPRELKEVEAESVALLCLAALGLPGQEFCRGYIQSWLDGSEIPEKSAQKIMRAADTILKAGRPAETKKRARKAKRGAMDGPRR